MYSMYYFEYSLCKCNCCYFLAFQKNYSLLQKVALHFKNINELEMKLSDYANDKKYNNILLLCFQFQFHLGYFSKCMLSIPVMSS